MDVDVSDSFL